MDFKNKFRILEQKWNMKLFRFIFLLIFEYFMGIIHSNIVEFWLFRFITNNITDRHNFLLQRTIPKTRGVLGMFGY